MHMDIRWTSAAQCRRLVFAAPSARMFFPVFQDPCLGGRTLAFDHSQTITFCSRKATDLQRSGFLKQAWHYETFWCTERTSRREHKTSWILVNWFAQVGIYYDCGTVFYLYLHVSSCVQKSLCVSLCIFFLTGKDAERLKTDLCKNIGASFHTNFLKDTYCCVLFQKCSRDTTGYQKIH